MNNISVESPRTRFSTNIPILRKKLKKVMLMQTRYPTVSQNRMSARWFYLVLYSPTFITILFTHAGFHLLLLFYWENIVQQSVLLTQTARSNHMANMHYCSPVTKVPGQRQSALMNIYGFTT